MDKKSIKALKEAVNKRSVYMTVIGRSMFPLFSEGQRVKVERAKEIKIGDVVVYYRDSRLFMHRVIWKKRNYLITKGDFSLYIDPPVYRKCIVGKVNKNSHRILGLCIGLGSLILGYFLKKLKHLPQPSF